MLGLDISVCKEVDKLIDIEPPLINEIFLEEREHSEKRLWKNFGYHKNEFPFIYKYVYRRLGLEGVRCLVMHFILDHIENIVCRGFDNEMIRDEVKALIHSYIGECSIILRHDNIFGESINILNKLLEFTLGNLEDIINVISDEVNLKLFPVDIIVNASSEIISIMLRGILITKGYRGKNGFSIDRDFFSKHYLQLRTKVKHLIRQKLYEALITQTIRDVQGLIKSLNNIRKKAIECKTVSEVFQIIREEAYNNNEFYKLLKIIQQSIEESLEPSQPRV